MTKVIWLGNIAESFEIGDLPIVPASMRAAYSHASMRKALRDIKLKIFSWSPALGTGWHLIWRLICLNCPILMVVMTLTAISAVLFYTPALFLRKFVQYLEVDPNRESKGWGWIYVLGLFVINVVVNLRKSFKKVCPCRYWLMTTVTGQLWSISSTTVQLRIKGQINSVLFAKTLIRKDVVSSAPPPSSGANENEGSIIEVPKKDEDNFSSKAQVITLMTTDVDRVCGFVWHIFSLVGLWCLPLHLTSISLTSKLDAPIEIAIGTIFLYDLLGMNIGLRMSIIFERFFFRHFLFLWSRCNMFLPSLEPLCWKSGSWYVAFMCPWSVIFTFEYSYSRKSIEGSWWASRSHEWSMLAFQLLSEWWMDLSSGFIGLGWNPHAQGTSDIHFFLNTCSNMRNLVYGLGT